MADRSASVESVDLNIARVSKDLINTGTIGVRSLVDEVKPGNEEQAIEVAWERVIRSKYGVGGSTLIQVRDSTSQAVELAHKGPSAVP